MSDRGDRDLPAGWVELKLADLAEVRLGRQRSPERAVGDHMRPYLRAANVRWAGLALDDVKEMDFTPREQETYRLRRGDILLAEASGSASEVGKPAIWNDEILGCCFQNTLLRVRTPDGMTKYLFWHLMADAQLGRFVGQAPGVGIHHLGAERLSAWRVKVAPKEEQTRIVAQIETQLTRIDAGVAALKRVQANLKRYRASVLKAAVEGRLVPTEAELARAEGRDYDPADKLLARILRERRARWEAAELAKMKAKGKPPTDSRWRAKYVEPEPPDTRGLPELPEGWCWTTAAAVCMQVVDCHNKTAPYETSGIPLVRTSNIRDGRLLLEDLRFVSESTYDFWSRRCRPEPGDVLFTREAPMGEAAMIPSGMRLCMGQRMMLMRADTQFLLSDYLLFALQAPLVAAFASRQGVGVGVQHLRVADVERLPIPLAPRSEQDRIAREVARVLSVAMQVANDLVSARSRASTLRQAVLRHAFDGKLVHQDPKDEPASAMLERVRSGASARVTEEPRPVRGRNVER